MKFLTIRDLRSKSSQIWKDLPGEQEMIITNNGRPVAILSSIDDRSFESSLNAIRRARAMEAVQSLQTESVKQGTHKFSLDEINREIESVRETRKS